MRRNPDVVAARQKAVRRILSGGFCFYCIHPENLSNIHLETGFLSLSTDRSTNFDIICACLPSTNFTVTTCADHLIMDINKKNTSYTENKSACCCSHNDGKVSAGFKNAQKQVDNWVKQYKAGYWPPLDNLARLVEEVGEVARVLNHRFGSKPKKETEDEQDLGEELADVLFSVICIANSQNIDLDEAFEKVMAKCNGRDKDRFEKR